MSSIDSSYTTPTGMTGAGGGNMLRITGMATGLDVDAMVKKMMAAEQVKLDKAKQSQQTIQWKQDAYKDIIKDIKDLQNTYFNSLTPDNNMLTSNNYAAFTANIVDSSVLSVTPGVTAQAGTYKIDFTGGHLASKAAISGTNINGKVTNPSLSTTLGDLGLSGSDSFNITYNGTIKTISVKNTDKLSDIINNITNATSGAVTASFSQLTGKFVIQSSNTGSSQNISIAAGAGDTLKVLGLTDGSGQGDDVKLMITPPGGTATTVTRSSNNFTIDGVTYNLQSDKDKDNSLNPAITNFTVTQDPQKVFDKINGFKDKYNDIVDKIQTKLSEKKSSDYKPLTDAQRAGMSASQISAWEDKAKVGILRNDNNLQNLLTSMRSAFTTAVSNTGLSFGQYGSNSIGLDTSNDITEGGKILIQDPQKLKDAISQHGDQILKLFTNVSSSDDKTTQFNENGIFERLNNIFNDNVGYVGTSLNSAILTSYANKQYDFSSTGSSGKNTLPDQLYVQQLTIKKITDEMSTKQEKYYMQFSQLETAMNRLNAQQAMLSSMISG